MGKIKERRPLPSGELGSHVQAMGKIKEGFQNEKRKIRHKQSSGYLRLYQVRLPAQSALSGIPESARIFHMFKGIGGFGDSPGVRDHEGREAGHRARNSHASFAQNSNGFSTRHRE